MSFGSRPGVSGGRRRRGVKSATGDVPPWLVPRTFESNEAALEARHRVAGRLGPVLESFIEQRDLLAMRSGDPVGMVHRFEDPLDQELVGLLASSLAFGNVKSILSSIERVLSVLGERPFQRLGGTRRRCLEDDLAGFSHRWIRGRDVAALLHAASRLQHEHGTLGRLFVGCLDEAGGELRPAVGSFVRAVRATAAQRSGSGGLPKGLGYLLPDGSGQGACKRLQMYLRWMVRGPDGVDLGLWRGVPRSILLVPLDTHTSRICGYLGLTARRDTSWRTAEEVTWFLRGMAPEDPTRYDFALAHLGISKECKHAFEASVCEPCELSGVCGLHTGHERGGKGAREL